MPCRVHIVIGPSAVGLTAHLQAKAIASHASLWLVPTEYHQVPDQNCLTFPQLAVRLAQAKSDESFLSEPQRRLLLGQVISELRQNRKLPVLGKLCQSANGLGLVHAFLAELKALRVGPKEFAEFAGEAAKGRSIDGEIELVYQRYQDFLSQHELLDRDAILSLALAKTKWQSLPPVFMVDGFAGFTAAELALLSRLPKQVDDLWLTLPGDEQDSDRFLAANRTQLFEAFTDARPTVTCLESNFAAQPSGAAHLSQYLFVDDALQSAKADGLTILEAPGIVGEVRMVARAVKQLLLDGALPDSIVLAVRNSESYADLIAELFAEYGIPHVVENELPLARIPVVASILRSVRIAQAGYRASDLSALLRNTLFQPAWPELAADSQQLLTCDILLRQLNEPRGRDAILNAATKLANEPYKPLEDELAAQSHRDTLQQQAKDCLPLLQRLMNLSVAAPAKGDLAAHGQWFAEFCTNFPPAMMDSALQQLLADLAGWAEREQYVSPRQSRSHDEFLDHLESLAAMATRPRSPVEPGLVRVLRAETAAAIPCEHLFLLGLGERGFPNLAIKPRLYSEGERAEFRGVGLELDQATERLPDEMLLFLRLATNALKSLTLSFPVTDGKGNEQLPGSFLRTIREDLFGQNAEGASVIPHLTRIMSTMGLDVDAPMSPGEERIRHARTRGRFALSQPDLATHLAAAQRVQQRRYDQPQFGENDGWLTSVTSRAIIAKQFGPQKGFSPTALESYIACPFRFFAQRVLRLEQLTDPSEEFEPHLRGSAYHRALTRLHRQPQASDPGRRLGDELARAFDENAARTGSSTTKLLWQLELERLQRLAKNYTGQSTRHDETWRPFGQPRPEYLEEDYEIVVQQGDERVVVCGRIDRIDVVESDSGLVGFLVVDYKTGSGSNYTKPAVVRLEHLQLAVYALAAEQKLDAEPMGLLYWLPLEKGPKVILKHGQFNWPSYRDQTRVWLVELAKRIRAGEFPLQPRRDDSCDFCDIKCVCRIVQGRRDKEWRLPLPMTECDGND